MRLYGISRAGLTIKQLGKLNRCHVPGDAMTVDLVVNVLLVLFISSNLAILYMSNIGYVLAHLLAVSGFLLLRTDRRTGRGRQAAGDLDPDRLVHDGPGGLPADRGCRRPHLNGYGTWTDFAIGVGVLAASVLLFIFRRVVQDGERIHFREETADHAGRGRLARGLRGARAGRSRGELIADDQTIVVGYDDTEASQRRWSAPRSSPRPSSRS